MKFYFQEPNWIKKYNHNYPVSKIPSELVQHLRKLAKTKISHTPDVSVIVPVWNEEHNVLKSIHSLLDQETDFQYEIIFVNNNSTDMTQEVLDLVQIPNYLEYKKGPGPARQKGLENAKGKIVLLADGDTIYPKTWLQNHAQKLINDPTAVAIYGFHSFISDFYTTRNHLQFYEILKIPIIWMRHWKRPHLNFLGMNSGFRKDYAEIYGFCDDDRRGEDGLMCWHLSHHGKILMNTSDKVKCWTITRSIQAKGTLAQNIKQKMQIEFKRFKGYFTPLKRA